MQSQEKGSNPLIKILVGILSFSALLFGASSDGCSTYNNIKNHFSHTETNQALISAENLVFDSMGHFLFEIYVPSDWDEISCGNLNCNIYKHPLINSISATVWVKPYPENSTLVDSIEFFGCPGNIDIFWCNENDVYEYEKFYGYKLNAKTYPKNALDDNPKAKKKIFPAGYEMIKINTQKSIIGYTKQEIDGLKEYKGYMIEYQSDDCFKYLLQCMAPEDKFIEYQNILNRIVSSFTPRIIESFRCCDYEIFYIN